VGPRTAAICGVSSYATGSPADPDAELTAFSQTSYSWILRGLTSKRRKGEDGERERKAVEG